MAMREYELMYIVRPTVPEEQLTASTERVDGMVTSLGGEVVDKQPWGKRRLAYPIEKHEDGYYVVARVNMEPGQTHELEEQLRITDEVIRHLLTHAPDKPSIIDGAAQANGSVQPPQASQFEEVEEADELDEEDLM